MFIVADGMGGHNAGDYASRFTVDTMVEEIERSFEQSPVKILENAIKIANKCMRIVYENIIFAISVKVICLILSAFGLTNMWLAIFADTGVMVIAVINAIRALRVKNL